MHCSPAQTAFTATVTRTNIGQHGARQWTNNVDRRQTTTYIAQRGWSSAVAGADLTLMSLHATYYFYLQNRYMRFADADSPMSRHASMC